MENKFSISGFKCFTNNNFFIKDLTVLCGSNGTGKSSFIQALLLVRNAIEKNAEFDKTSKTYKLSNWKDSLIPLNQGYELSLGVNNDIFNADSFQDFLDIIVISLDTDVFNIFIPDDNADETAVEITNQIEAHSNTKNDFWKKLEFYYLNAERIGPRFELVSNSTDFLHCGYKGEFSAKVLLNKGGFFKVNENRRFKGTIGEFLPLQVDAWMNYICPGTFVKPEQIGKLSAQIELRNNSVSKFISAPNLGFGISYALPIIITGLIAIEGAMFVVENPEAHLHPKAQSNIGYFLGKIAAAGVRIIIETHSEHVVNGIRRAAIEVGNNFINNINIYFFEDCNFKDTITPDPITISTSGDLNKFPRDFFDQVQQDMLELYKMQKKSNGQISDIQK